MNFITHLKCSIFRRNRLFEILKWDGVDTGVDIFCLSYYSFFIKSSFQRQIVYLERISQC